MTPKLSKPKPGWLNKREMAASLGISVQAFAQWGVEPVARIGREVFFSAKDVLANRLLHSAEKVQRSEPEGGSAGSNLDLERELLIREQREGQALKNAEMRRELAPVGVIEWALGRVAAQLSAQLDSLVPRLKRTAPFLTAANLEQVTREVVKAKNAAARIQVDLDEYRRDSVRG